MSHNRLTTWQKATALVPLALLSGAWTTSIAATSSANDEGSTTTLPDGTTVPDQALESPASMTRPGSIAPGVPAGAADSVIASASMNGIPDAALAAYQRAEQVINSADASCNLQWQLVAAIGRVESDHGRYGGNILGEDGKSRPGIYGIPLDGSNGTQQIRDTDAGDLDDDKVYDRAVGAMQFIPQTWNVVGVDGDGDGKRDPQDIDDAALASAVYLCSGDEDLSTYGGQKAAVYRYNHSEEYVDLVIEITRAYLAGEFSSVPNGVAGAAVITPDYGDAVVMPTTTGRGRPWSTGGGEGRGSFGSGGASSGRSTGSDGGTSSPTDTPEAPAADGGATGPVEETTKKARDTAKDTTDTVKDTTENTLTKAEATERCLDSGISELDVVGLAACVDDLLNG